jgi:hypothetical protein
MAKNKGDVVVLTDDDFKTKKFKTAPGGKYVLTIAKSKSKIKPGNSGNNLQLVLTISKGPHKKVNIFDHISPNVGWKIAQILKALGKKKVKKITLQELLKMLEGKDIGAVVKVTQWNGQPQNKIVQYLPVKDIKDDDDEDEEGEEDEEDEDDSDLLNAEDDEDDDEEEEEEEEDEEEEEEEEEEEGEEEEDDEEEEGEEEDEEEEEEEEEEEDDEEEEPAPRRRAAKKAAKKKSTRKRAAKKAAKRGRKK